MSVRLFSILSALSGIIGVILLVVSFTLNPAPPTGNAQLIAYGREYHNAILVGAWLQAISPLLIVFFVLAIVHLAGATTRFSGWATLCGSIILVVVSLMEVTLYLGAANANNLTIVLVSLSLIKAVQHLYSIIAAPALIIPIGLVVVNSRVLPHILGYIAIVAGILFAIAGVVYLFTPVVDGIAALSVIQAIEELWFPVAAITLLIRTLTKAPTEKVQERESVTA
jgi:hypothetical protein